MKYCHLEKRGFGTRNIVVKNKDNGHVIVDRLNVQKFFKMFYMHEDKIPRKLKDQWIETF